MSKSMRAAVVTRPGEIKVQEMPIPEIGASEVLVRVISGSICNATDWHILNGSFHGYHDHYPQVTGHECFGEVVELGADVDCVRRGEKIVFYSPNGAFCEYVKFAIQDDVFAKADDLSPEVACLCEMFHGAFLGLTYPAQLKTTDNVLIVGQGPMGLTTMQLVKAIGVNSITTLDLIESRTVLSEQLGADHAICTDKLSLPDIVETVKARVPRIDVALVCIDLDQSADLSAYDVCVELLQSGGRLSGLHVAVKDVNHRVNAARVITKNIRLAHFLEKVYPDDRRFSLAIRRALFGQAVDWVRHNEIRLQPLVTDIVSLEEVHSGIMRCKENPETTTKVVVRVAD